jgi:RNA polymerase sigma-70 factor (ECF subfamily)
MKMVPEEEALDFASDGPAPDARLLEEADTNSLRRAIEELPVEFREALVMRELEGLSYKEIAEVANVPMGTVMSRLARARRLLREGLLKNGSKG